MKFSSIRRIGGLAVGLSIAAAAIALAPSARAADFHIVLNQGMMGGPGVSGGNGNYDQTFAAVQITGLLDSGTRYNLRASDSDIPLAWEYYPGDTVHGSGSFSMTGTYDSSSGAVTGTFNYANTATGTIKGSLGDLALDFSMTWQGDVTGSITGTVAALKFAGTDATVCTMGGEDCGVTGSQSMTVWFTVAGSAPTTVPEDAGNGDNVVVVSGATGDVYLSPASEAGVETAQRTWQLVKPGDRISLTDGVMLRTGRDGSLKVQFMDSSTIRLQPSTLFSVQKVVMQNTPQMEVYTRLFNGIADFYMHKWAEDHKKFEVEVDRAIVSIDGTTWTMAVTDTATVVSVSEGVVALTDKASGETIDVNPGEQATVDAAGTRKAPAASPSFEADLAVESPATASSQPMTLADLGLGSRGGGASPILILAIAAGVFAACAIVALSVRKKRLIT
jgi:hypothetical protein